jgi:hypothetical protein
MLDRPCSPSSAGARTASEMGLLHPQEYRHGRPT